MIGIGKWAVSVDTMMFRGDAVCCVADKNGAYDFSVEIKGMAVPSYNVEQITEDGNTLNAVVTTSILPGKQISVSMTFEGDTVTGFIKVPLLGKIKIKNGHRIG